jgi:hypothetical protein
MMSFILLLRVTPSTPKARTFCLQTDVGLITNNAKKQEGKYYTSLSRQPRLGVVTTPVTCDGGVEYDGFR